MWTSRHDFGNSFIVQYVSLRKEQVCVCFVPHSADLLLFVNVGDPWKKLISKTLYLERLQIS
jgi:hypothetical protein